MSHPIFARLFMAMTRFEGRRLTRARGELVGDLRGRVLEIGCGNGMLFAHYADEVELVATEPEPVLRRAAQQRARELGRTVEVLDAPGEQLPLPDASVDAVVCMLVLCSVADPARVLAEAHRVLRPGGVLRLHEHVASSEARLAKVQRVIDPVWATFAGGCRLVRDPAAAVRAAGFQVRSEARFAMTLMPLAPVVSPQLVVDARRV